MRKSIVISVLTVALVMAMTTAMADTVTLPNVTADLSYSNDFGGVTSGNTLQINLDLPFSLEGINSTGGADYLNITAEAGNDATVNVTVNSVAVLTNYVISAGTTKQITFTDISSAGVDMNATSLAISIKAVANNTTTSLLVMGANDSLLKDNYTVNVTETLLVTPEVDASAYAVKDNISITQNSDVNITDVNATLSYPSYTVSTSQPSYYNFGSLNTSETKYTNVSYQKKAPFVSSGSYTESASTGKITTKLKIYSYENLTVSFAFNPTSKSYSKWFPNYSGSVSSIKLNDKSISYKASSNSITISSMAVNEGYNTLEITYAPSTGVAGTMAPIAIVTPTQPWYYQTDPIFNIQYWFWAVVVGVIAAIIVVGRG